MPGDAPVGTTGRVQGVTGVSRDNAVQTSIYVLLFFPSFLPSLPYPMPYMVVLSCTPMSSLWNAKNLLYPAIERLKVLVSIIAPMNFVEV